MDGLERLDHHLPRPRARRHHRATGRRHASPARRRRHRNAMAAHDRRDDAQRRLWQAQALAPCSPSTSPCAPQRAGASERAEGEAGERRPAPQAHRTPLGGGPAATAERQGRWIGAHSPTASGRAGAEAPEGLHSRPDRAGPTRAHHACRPQVMGSRETGLPTRIRRQDMSTCLRAGRRLKSSRHSPHPPILQSARRPCDPAPSQDPSWTRCGPPATAC